MFGPDLHLLRRCLLLQGVSADPVSGQDVTAGAGPSDGGGPSADAAATDGQERLPTNGKGRTGNHGDNDAAAAQGDKSKAQKSKKAAKVQLYPFQPPPFPPNHYEVGTYLALLAVLLVFKHPCYKYLLAAKLRLTQLTPYPCALLNTKLFLMPQASINLCPQHPGAQQHAIPYLSTAPCTCSHCT